MELYFLTLPRQEREAAQRRCLRAHQAYGMGMTQLELTVGQLGLDVRGGWMVLDDSTLPEEGEAAQLADQIRQEMHRRTYTALVLDFERLPSLRSRAVIAALGEQRLPLVVPRAYAEDAPEAQVLIESTVASGELEAALRAAAELYPGRCVLALERTRLRCWLPAEEGACELLSPEELETLLAGRQSYFSRELGLRYCTIREGDRFAFVRFDDAASLRHKLRLAEGLGFTAALGVYQELREFLPL